LIYSNCIPQLLQSSQFSICYNIKDLVPQFLVPLYFHIYVVLLFDMCLF
jgi:hypothetical protein